MIKSNYKALILALGKNFTVLYLKFLSCLLTEGVQEPESSPHGVGRCKELLKHVGPSGKESGHGDLPPVEAVGDAVPVGLELGWGPSLLLDVGDNAGSFARASVVVNSALSEHLDCRPGSNVELFSEKMLFCFILFYCGCNNTRKGRQRTMR